MNCCILSLFSIITMLIIELYSLKFICHAYTEFHATCIWWKKIWFYVLVNSFTLLPHAFQKIYFQVKGWGEGSRYSTEKFPNLWCYALELTGCPKKMLLLSSFEFLTLGRVFLGVKNNSKNFGNKKNIILLSKILSKLTLFIRKMQKVWWFCQVFSFWPLEGCF